jgi:hypothetical protein
VMILGEMCVLLLIYCYIAVCMFCAVRYVAVRMFCAVRYVAVRMFYAVSYLSVSCLSLLFSN